MIFLIISIVIFYLVLFFVPNIKININAFLNKHYRKIILMIFFLCVFTSIYKLGLVPRGLNVDEAGMFTDAKMIAKYGYDRYLNIYPIYLINFGSGQSAMYAYLVVLLIKVFGSHVLLIRIPIVIFRIIAFIAAYYLIRNTKDKLTIVIFLLLFSICPYFIMQSRWGLDCNLLIYFIIISISLLYNSLISNNKILLFLSGLLFGISLYTYALSFIIIPLFLLFIFIYLLCIQKISIKDLLIFITPLFIVSIPLILFILINMGFINNINTFITIPKLPEFRGGELSLVNIKNIITLPFIIFCHDYYIYNSIPYFGTIYYISIPFVLYGFYYSFKTFKKDFYKKNITINTIMIFLFISSLICLLLIESPNINKANVIFFPLIYFTTMGIINVNKIKKGSIIIYLLLYFVYFISFSYYYYFEYNKNYKTPIFFATDYLDVLKYVNKQKEDIIYIDPDVENEPYLYLYVYNDIEKYNEKIINFKDKTYIIKNTNIVDNSLYISSKDKDMNICKKIGNIKVYCNRKGN